METLTPQQAEARARTMLAYLRGITSENYDVKVLAVGDSPNHPNNASLEFTLSATDIKSAPDHIKAILSVPVEIIKISRRYESTIVLPTDGRNIIWYIKPDTGKHSHTPTYGRPLHAGSTELDWIRQRIETRRKVPQTA